VGDSVGGAGQAAKSHLVFVVVVVSSRPNPQPLVFCAESLNPCSNMRRHLLLLLVLQTTTASKAMTPREQWLAATGATKATIGPSELKYWTRMIRDGWRFDAKHDFSAELLKRLNYSTPFVFEEELRSLALAGQQLFRVLDVGSGPISAAGWTLGGGLQLEVVATDPLGSAYNRLLDEHDGYHPTPSGGRIVGPKVRALTVEAEALLDVFARDSFDLVMSKNAIDHAYDPLLSLVQMLSVVKPRRAVMLDLYEREGEMQKYAGLHQHNFQWRDGRLMYWAREGPKTDVANEPRLKELLDSVSCRKGILPGVVSTGSSDYRAMSCRLIRRG